MLEETIVCLRDLGFVFENKKKWFITPLMKKWLDIKRSDTIEEGKESSESSKRFLLVCPNFKVYAKTDDDNYRLLVKTLIDVET